MTNGIDHHGKHARGQQPPAKKRTSKKAPKKAAAPKGATRAWVDAAVLGKKPISD